MGLARIPWWTTDIGGFHGGDQKIKISETTVRWFEYGTFCPVMRLHGYREPLKGLWERKVGQPVFPG